MKLAYEFGCLNALIKLGVTVLQKELSPATKAYMQRLTGFDAPTTALDPSLRKAQREFKHVVQTRMPEFIGASEAYQKAPKNKRVGGLTPEGISRSKEQGRILQDWHRSRGQMAVLAPGAQKPVTPVLERTTAATPRALAQSSRPSPGTAETAYNIIARKSRPGIQFAKTLARRFAHI